MTAETNDVEKFDDRAARVLEQLEGEPEDDGTGEEGGEEAPRTETEKEEAAADDAAITPPVSWPAAEKESFKKLPRELQDVVAKREAERERHVSQRSQHLAQQERALEQQRVAYAQRLDAFLSEVQANGAAGRGESPEELAKLARENPVAFAQRVAAAQQRAQLAMAADAERRQVAEEHGRSYIAREFQQLATKLPEFRDAAQRQAILGELGNYLQEAGFTREELGGVADHRTYLVALDAMRYRKLMKAQKQAAAKRVVTAPKVQKPGAAADSDAGDGRLQKLKKAARRTGKLDDRAAYVLAALRDS
jgi:hypothetical protein